MNIFDINLFGIHIAPSYYGLMYAIGFLLGYYIINSRAKISNNYLDDLFFYIVLGVILGGRLGYVILYNFFYYLNNPINIFKVWEGGMSFHGGVIGVLVAMIIFSKKYKINFYTLADQIVLVLPIGLGLGRIGNYLNKELLGFSNYYGPFNINGYFPSPLVEMFLEGFVLFFVLNYLYNKKIYKNNGVIASLFLILYGIFRIFVEVFFREPDKHIGYIFNYFTLGEIYSFPMIIIGIYFYFKLRKRPNFYKN